MEKNNQKNQSPSFFKEMKSFIKPYKLRFALSVVISILGVLCNLISYVLIGLIIGFVFKPNTSLNTFFIYAILVLALKIMNAVFLNLSTWISHKAAYHTLRDIRYAVVQKFKKLPLGYFEKNGSGRLNTVIVDRIEGMEVTLAHVLPELTANLLCPLLLVVWMFVIDWKIGLIVLIWIIIGFSLSGGMFKGYEEKFKGQIKAFKGMNQAIVEYVGGIKVIKNFGRSDSCYKKYEDSIYNHANYNINWRKETQRYSAAGMCMGPFPIFPVLIFGLIFFSNGTLDLPSLFLLIIISLGIFGPLMVASGYFDNLAQMGTNAKEIKDVLDYKEIKRGNEVSFPSFDIEYKDVSFSYDEKEKTNGENLALNNVSFKIKEGEMFALVGKSGSGKSTIAKLLATYFDVNSGEILIGGKSLSSYSQEALNKKIAYVDQDTFLFDLSIMDNVRMGNPSLTDEEVKQICKRCGCDDFITSLPDGYNTMAGRGGVKLSGGEKQRICIARAMAKEASILILDEATSSSDPENEDKIQQSLKACCEGKTLIVVAHRLKTIVNASKIAFVKDGKVTNIAKHEELLKIDNDYKAMWDSSKGEEEDE